MSTQIETPKQAGRYDVTVRDLTIFAAYFNPSTGHWISDTGLEIGFGDIIVPPNSDNEQRIIKISQLLK